MDQHENENQDDRPPTPGASDADSLGPITISTTDPGIEIVTEHPFDWKLHPDATTCIETMEAVEPLPLFVPGVRRVDLEDQQASHGKQSDHGGKPDNGNRSRSDQAGSQARKDHEDDDHRARAREPDHGNDAKRETKKGGEPERGHGQLKENDRGGGPERDVDDHANEPRSGERKSMTKNLLIVGAVAVLCGALGGAAYLYFFGSNSDGPSSEKSQHKGQSTSHGHANSTKARGGGAIQKSADGSSAPSSSSVAGFTSAEDAGTLKKQIADLMQRIDRLGDRVDRPTRPIPTSSKGADWIASLRQTDDRRN